MLCMYCVLCVLCVYNLYDVHCGVVYIVCYLKRPPRGGHFAGMALESNNWHLIHLIGYHPIIGQLLDTVFSICKFLICF